jgi:septal ring factor EnvC (AmiA/AmiB activator)
MGYIMEHIWIASVVVALVVAIFAAYVVTVSYKHDAYVAHLEMEDANSRVTHAHRVILDIKAELATEKTKTRDAAANIDSLNDDIERAISSHQAMERDYEALVKEIDRLSSMAEPDEVAPPPNVRPTIRSIDIT